MGSSTLRSAGNTPEKSQGGRLAVLLPGMGAVATTTMAGVLLARNGLAQPIGSLSQLGTLPLASGPVSLRDHLPIASMSQLDFGGWDIFPESAYEAAQHADVIKPQHLEAIREELERIRPMKAVFSPDYVRRLNGTHLKTGRTKADLVEQLREDIRNHLKRRECDRAVGIWCGSTEIYSQPTAVHASIGAFEKGLLENDPDISPSQMYAWAFLMEGFPFANGSPNLSVDFPAALALAKERGVAIAGKDFKTGQTLMKTVLAPMLKARKLGVRGWFSTNILGNRDGEVLDEPESFRTKEVSKKGVLEQLLTNSDQMLYGDLFHKVRIEYYPPRGDEKEAWDNIDLFGWLGYPMQLKVNFLCRDSILAAPIVLDLALFLDLAQRSGESGLQDWLGFYFKSPMAHGGRDPEHDLFKQEATLYRKLAGLAGSPAVLAGEIDAA